MYGLVLFTTFCVITVIGFTKTINFYMDHPGSDFHRDTIKARESFQPYSRALSTHFIHLIDILSKAAYHCVGPCLKEAARNWVHEDLLSILLYLIVIVFLCCQAFRRSGCCAGIAVVLATSLVSFVIFLLYTEALFNLDWIVERDSVPLSRCWKKLYWKHSVDNTVLGVYELHSSLL